MSRLTHRAATTTVSLALSLALLGTAAVAQERPANPMSAWAASTPVAPVQAREVKSPGTSALLSFLITGAGQVYNEEGLKGGLMFAGAVVFTVIAIDGIDEYDCDPTEDCWSWMLPVGLVGAVGLKIWSIFDATAGARRFNERAAAGGGAGLRPDFSLVPLGGGRVGIGLLRATF